LWGLCTTLIIKDCNTKKISYSLGFVRFMQRRVGKYLSPLSLCLSADTSPELSLWTRALSSSQPQSQDWWELATQGSSRRDACLRIGSTPDTRFLSTVTVANR
jgi:hypothetical protein